MQTRRKRFNKAEKTTSIDTKAKKVADDVTIGDDAMPSLESQVSRISYQSDATRGHAIDVDDDDYSPAHPKSSSRHSLFQDDQSAAERLDMRLLGLEDGKRSDVMRQLVTSFQNKVQTCFDSFSPDLALSCLRIVTSVSALKPSAKTPKHGWPVTGSRHSPNNDWESPTPNDPFSELDYKDAMTRELPNFTVSRLRTTIQQILRRATLRQDGSLYFPGASQTAMATKSVQYFIWYFEFMEYLQELHVNFVEKIFTPMFKYFHDFNFLGSHGRTTTMSSAFSKFSQMLDGSVSDEERDGEENMDERVPVKDQAKTSLKTLSKEYKDIKAIYDTSEIDKIAQRLSLIKDQIVYLLEEENEIDPEMYSNDSGRAIQHLNMDFGTENLLRLVPDILVKLRKSAWLVHRWLELDDQRTKDVNKKLEKIASIEEQLVKRLDILKTDICRDEKLLEEETHELGLLMDREGRSDKLSVQTYDIDGRIEKLQKELKLLKIERDSFPPKLAEIVKSKNLREYHKLKFIFESNKLQRFVTERKLSSLSYQRNLLKDDLNLELFIRPSVIYSSNKVQDECERLEKVIREQKEKVSTIKHALLPIQEDKTSLINRLNRQFEDESVVSNSNNRGDVQKRGNAIFVRSFYNDRSFGTSAPNPQNTGRRVTVQPRTFLIRQLPAGNNRVSRTSTIRVISPPTW